MSILKAVNITKVYPGTVALDNVSVEFTSGTINAFVGKNGSGKSTLMKIFSGAEVKTEGEVWLDDKKLEPKSPADAIEVGISTVYQELSLVMSLTVMENIFMGRLPSSGGIVNWKETEKRAQELLDELHLTSIKPTDIVGELSASQRQMVEIAKAMSFNPKVLQLDEPTSSLAREETESLFEVLRYLKTKDVIIIYVTHKLHELWRVCDTCTVLRDGHFIGKVVLSESSNEEVLGMMFGDVKVRSIPEDLKPGSEVILKVENLSNGKKFHNINLELRKGEIVGIAGMLGSGRSELMLSIFGADKHDSGKIFLNGQEVTNPTPEKMKKLGLGMIQEDRQKVGIIKQHTIKDNITTASVYKIGKGMFLDRKQEVQMAEKQVRDLEIKISSIKDLITTLSGGNMQKVVVGNWLNTDPKVMMLDEPSRGIDVNAKQQIFEIMWEMARQGIPSIVVSSELEELIGICHRIIIMKDGEFINEVDPKDMTAEKLYIECMGGEGK